jgi:hypothetical protein
MTSLITVIPVWNGERFLAKTLESVARQTRRPDRLIVLDNCSTDGTRSIVERFRDMPCEWRQNEANLGLFGNLNRALGLAAETEFLHILHADDLVLPEFYHATVDAMAGTMGPGMAYCHCELIDEVGGKVGATATPQSNGAPLKVSVERFVAERAELRPFYCPSVLLRTAGQPSPCSFRLDLPQLADLLFWAEWAAQTREVFESPRSLCQYRLHGGSDTARNASRLQSWILDEWRTMEMIAALLQEPAPGAWLRRHKLKCIFAARSEVKIRQVRQQSPEFAIQIAAAIRTVVSPLHQVLGRLAVGLRDGFK